MQIRGIKRGQTIELLHELALPDGCEIVLQIAPETFLNPEERLQRLRELFGVWANQPDLEANFAAIATERHRYRGREILSFD